MIERDSLVVEHARTSLVLCSDRWVECASTRTTCVVPVKRKRTGEIKNGRVSCQLGFGGLRAPDSPIGIARRILSVERLISCAVQSFVVSELRFA